MSKEVYRIEIPIETVDKYSPGLKTAGKQVTKFENAVQKTAKRVNKRLDDLTGGRWSVTIRAVDRASRVISSVNSFAGKVAGRTYHLTFRAIDMVTRPVRNIIKNITSSAFGLLGIAGGVAGGVVLPLKVTMDRQNITTAFEVLLGSTEKANERITELIDFAGQTPYTRDEIFRSSRVLEVFTKGAISTGEGLRMVGDIAAGTQNEFEDVALWIGRMYDAMSSNEKIGAMTSRLQEMGAIDGAARARLEKLAEQPMDIAKKWELARKEFQRFDGMMGKMSNNLANLLLGVKSFFMNNVISRWGAGIERVLSPALSKFRVWRNENVEGIQNLGNAIERYGERVTKFVVNKVGGAFGTIQRLFFPSQKEIERMTELQKHLLPEDAAQLPINLTFSDKVKMAWDDIVVKPFQEWWEGKGKKWVGETGLLLGEAIFKGVKKGFKNGLDGIGNMWGDALENPSASSIGGAMTSTLIAGAVGSMVLSPLTKGLGKVLKGGKWLSGLALGAGAWAMNKVFKKQPKVTNRTKTTGETANNNSRQTTSKRYYVNPANDNVKKPVILDQYGNPLPPSTQAKPSQPTPKTESKSWFKLPEIKTPKWIKELGSSMKNLGKGSLKRVPLLGTILSGLSLLSVSKEELPGAVGSLGGGLAGASAGAALGSVVPGVGTVIGGIAGGIGGSIGGEKLLTWLFGPKEAAAAELKERQMTGYDPSLAGSNIGENMGALNVPMQEISSNLSTLSSNISQASEWILGAFSPLGETANLVNHNLSLLTSYLGQASGWVVGAFYPLSEEAGDVGHNMSLLTSYIGEACGWVVGAFHPLVSESERVKSNLSLLTSYVGQASGWVASLNGIQTAANSVKSALNNLATRINNVKVSMPSLSSPQSNSSSNVSRGATLSAYANGGYIDRPHLGLVGEAGPEMIIPLSSGRRSRALDLYQQAGRMLGVKPYADGGLVGKFIDNNESAIIPSVGTTVVIDGVKTEVNITVQGDSEIDTKGLGEKIADDVANAIIRKAKEVAKNMPIPAN